MDAYRNAAEFAELTTLGITPKKVARMKDARGMRLRVQTGSVWITHDDCQKDVCLNAGESHCITHDGLTVIAALECPLALVSLEPQVPVERSRTVEMPTYEDYLADPAAVLTRIERVARAERAQEMHRLLLAPLARVWMHTAHMARPRLQTRAA